MDRAKFIPPAEEKTYELEDGETPALQSILLVEDETEFAATIKEYLESCDFSVTIATDGVQGLKRVMERDFDLVLCDLLMPNLPGDMFHLAVQRVKPGLAKKFVFITGHQHDPKIVEFLKSNRALTLFKPFQMHVLLETIRAALNGGKGARS